MCFNEVRQRNIWNSVLPPRQKSCALEVSGASFLFSGDSIRMEKMVQGMIHAAMILQFSVDHISP